MAGEVPQAALTVATEVETADSACFLVLSSTYPLMSGPPQEPSALRFRALAFARVDALFAAAFFADFLVTNFPDFPDTLTFGVAFLAEAAGVVLFFVAAFFTADFVATDFEREDTAFFFAIFASKVEWTKPYNTAKLN